MAVAAVLQVGAGRIDYCSAEYRLQIREQVLAADLAAIRDGLADYRSLTGRPPRSLFDLVRSRLLRSVPVDPFTQSESTWILVRDHNGGIIDVGSDREQRDR